MIDFTLLKNNFDDVVVVDFETTPIPDTRVIEDIEKIWMIGWSWKEEAGGMMDEYMGGGMMDMYMYGGMAKKKNRYGYMGGGMTMGRGLLDMMPFKRRIV
jgi:hypothetical protein